MSFICAKRDGDKCEHLLKFDFSRDENSLFCESRSGKRSFVLFLLTVASTINFSISFQTATLFTSYSLAQDIFSAFPLIGQTRNIEEEHKFRLCLNSNNPGECFVYSFCLHCACACILRSGPAL